MSPHPQPSPHPGIQFQKQVEACEACCPLIPQWLQQPQDEAGWDPHSKRHRTAPSLLEVPRTCAAARLCQALGGCLGLGSLESTHPLLADEVLALTGLLQLSGTPIQKAEKLISPPTAGKGWGRVRTWGPLASCLGAQQN